MEPVAELIAILAHWIRWLRLRRAATWAVRGLGLGLAAGLAVSILALLNGRLLQAEFGGLVAAAGLAGLALGGTIAFGWPVPRLAAARFFDRRLSLQERTSTALEIAGLPSHPEDLPARADLHLRQLMDTLDAARKVDVRASLPLQIAWQEILLALVLIGSAVLSARFGQPYFQAAQNQRLVEEAIAAEIATIEEILRQVERNESLTPEARETLTSSLENAREQLQQAQTLEGSVSILSSLERDLRRQADPQAEAFAQQLRQTGESLRGDAGSALQSAGQQLSQGEVQAAARSLAELDPAQLSPEERAALAQGLEETASSLEEANPALAEQLEEAAAELGAGNGEAARQALQEAAGTLADAGGKVAQAEEAGRAASQVAAGKDRLLQGPAEASSFPTAGATPPSGQASSGTGPPSTGSGSLSETGSPEAGGGSGRGDGTGESGAGPQAGIDPIGTENGPGDGGERPYAPIYAPERLGGNGGQEVTLPGSGQPGEATIGQGEALPDPGASSQIPYVEVFPEYAEAYRQAMESGQVPLLLRQVVRDYFSSLEP